MELHFLLNTHRYLSIGKGKGKGKAVPLLAWSGPEGSKKDKVPRFHDNGTGWW